MIFIDFVNTYINKKVDYDNNYGAQCVDLFRQFCTDVLNIPHTGGVEGAKDLYLNYEFLPLEQKYFKKVSSDDLSTGDVAVWGATPSNRYGHVAIVVGIKKDNIIVFEQDGFKQDGAKINIRSKNNLLGGLRLKNGDII